ncbi:MULTISPECIES: site-specific integrase [Hydrocarboniphaga]|uniref:site-specific integrase n=1 Tax=Hydrocarboniphaga TaxID=243627 RepID=UPI002AB85100|nr:site-specific integrase [Hydrocarboniphaga sp.]MDZ4078420.1 site-specific integrase [Hydrocarboniphaga sp.]
MASIRKREQVGKDGKRTVKYDATITKRGARRQTKTFLTKAAAEKWARKVEGDIETGSWIDPTAAHQMTVARALDIYLAEVVPHLKSAAFEPPKADNLKKRLGSISLSALTTIELARYRDSRLTDRVRRGAGTKGGGTVELNRTVAPQSVKHELGLLNRALAHVEHEHGITFPRGRPKLDHRRSNVLALPPGRNRTLRPEETTRLRDACMVGQGASDGAYASLKASRSFWLWPIVEFAMETAARRNEILALRWEDVDKASNTITLKNKKTPRSKAPETRTIPASPRVQEILEGLPKPTGKGHYVFGGITANALSQQFKRAVRRAELEDFKFHDLRHVGATRLATVLDGDLLMLADMTGHQDIRMLRRYVAPRRSEIARRLNLAHAAVPTSGAG